MRNDLAERTLLFALRIVKLCQELGAKQDVKGILSKQLLRAGTSIGANVAEGEGAQSEADFLTKYSIALKEAHETKYWLKLLVLSELVESTRLSDLQQECSELVAILITICKKLKAKRK